MSLKKAGCILLMLLLLTTSACQQTPSPGPVDESEPQLEATLVYYTIGTPDRDMAAVNDALNKLLKKKINVQLEYKKINWSDYGTTLSNIIHSGTYFDIAFTTEGDQGDYSGYAKKGVWLELDPYLETIGKDMYDAIDPLLWYGVKINDKIYGVPTNKEVAVPEWWIYKKELVDKYGIDISKYNTLESLEPLFKMISVKEPGYTIMELDRNSRNFFALEDYEYVLNRDVPLMVKSTDQSLKIVNIFETELARRTLDTLRKYYKEGYINEDAAVKSGSELGRDPKVFWREAGAGPYPTTSWSKDTGFEVTARQVTSSIATTESARGGIMAVNANSQNPEACIRFLNCLNTDPEVRNLINFGVEGVHYDLTPDGQVAVKPEGGYTGVQYTQGNWFILKTLKGDPLNKWEEYKRFNSESIRSEALGFTPDISDPAVSSVLTAVSNVTAKYYYSLMTGTVDPKVVLPMFLKELQAAGIDSLRNTFQKQIDAWKAKQKNSR